MNKGYGPTNKTETRHVAFARENASSEIEGLQRESGRATLPDSRRRRLGWRI